MATNEFTVFTKPWPDKSLTELGRFVHDLGFDGVELPVRPDFQVIPDKVTDGLPEAARILADEGVKIGSIAGTIDRATIEACGVAGVPVIRVCESIDMEIGYFESEKRIIERYREVVPILSNSGVAIGVQNHCGTDIGSAIGVMHLVGEFDPKQVGVVLDLAHCGFDGEPEEMAIDIAWSHLLLINLKSGYRRRTAGPEIKDAGWELHWTTGGQGIVNWKRTIDELKRRGYRGDYCLTAEYTLRDMADRLVTEDIAYAKSLL